MLAMIYQVMSLLGDTIFERRRASLLPRTLFLSAGGQESQLRRDAMRKLPERSDKKTTKPMLFVPFTIKTDVQRGLLTPFAAER